MVSGGRILLLKGYGHADVAERIPIDPRKSVFLRGSLSKLFTWTAVMQLVEQGRLDLDADVNTYLDFRIPATSPNAITPHHLMAHSSGSEDVKFEQMAATPAGLTPLGACLERHVPLRVHPPGKCSAYGNYGVALAGHIVERVSGMSYDDYIDKHILGPLGMAHTTSRQPVPAALVPELSQCYTYGDGRYQSRPLMAEVAANVAPAASFRSSAADMARFMIALMSKSVDNTSTDARPPIPQPATAHAPPELLPRPARERHGSRLLGAGQKRPDHRRPCRLALRRQCLLDAHARARPGSVCRHQRPRRDRLRRGEPLRLRAGS
jgi:CubicO group peptidase (beta-lactamase class C family)